MKNILIPALGLLLLTACSGNKEKNKPEIKEEQPTISPAGISDADKATKEWLQQKEWKADNEAAPFGTLKLYADGKCDYISGQDPWTIKDGALTLGKYGSFTWLLKKVNDTSFTIFVEPTQKTFTYNFVKTL